MRLDRPSVKEMLLLRSFSVRQSEGVGTYSVRMGACAYIAKDEYRPVLVAGGDSNNLTTRDYYSHRPESGQDKCSERLLTPSISFSFSSVLVL